MGDVIQVAPLAEHFIVRRLVPAEADKLSGESGAFQPGAVCVDGACFHAVKGDGGVMIPRLTNAASQRALIVAKLVPVRFRSARPTGAEY